MTSLRMKKKGSVKKIKLEIRPNDQQIETQIDCKKRRRRRPLAREETCHKHVLGYLWVGRGQELRVISSAM